MERADIIKRFSEAGMLVSPEVLILIEASSDAEALIGKLIASAPETAVITPSFFDEMMKKEEEKKIPVPVEVKRASNFKPEAKEHESKMKFLDRFDITGKSRCTGTVSDFHRYFTDRLEKLRGELRGRVSQFGFSRISSLKNVVGGKEMRIIGMVYSKRITRNGHLLVELEDEEGIAKVLFMKSGRAGEQPLFDAGRSLVNDEVVAIDGVVSGPFFIARNMAWPDLPIGDQKKSERDLCIGLLSDFHLGSRFFLEEKFQRFISWLHGAWGNDIQMQLAGKVKYLIIAGDIVDGIGIYPNQEKELILKDIFEQYGLLSKLLEAIPDYMEVIISPGNHDAVRRAEPQPRISEELVQASNGKVHFVGNPAMVELEGLKTLIYHGTSLDSIISSIPGMSYAHPEKPMTELLKRRNLSPIYGENPIVPEERDYMLVDEIPDIIHMGHVHKNGYANYRGTVLINSGTWQDRTDFQVKQGHVPTPCILPVYSAHYGKINVIDFNEGEMSVEY